LLLLVIALIGIALLASVVLKKRAARSSEPDAWPFYKKKPLSGPEQVLYHRLVSALPEHIVLAQVQVSRVLGVKKGQNFSHWNNRINRMTYDFVVCAKDATVIAAIELDDKTHEAPSRIEADTRKEQATQAAGIRLIRWHVKTLPDHDAIRFAISEANAPLAIAPKPGRNKASAAPLDFKPSA
jgi:hypothetical protein